MGALFLLFLFFQIGIIGFGGGYAMISIIFNEVQRLGITPEQFADLTALDLVVPGPIAINAATYVGYLHSGVPGSIMATIGVCLPSFVLVLAVMYFMEKFRENTLLQDFLSGVKPAAVGLIAAAAMTIAGEVLLNEGQTLAHVLTEPLAVFSPVCVMIFAGTALLNIKWKVNPILLTVAGGVAGVLFL